MKFWHTILGGTGSVTTRRIINLLTFVAITSTTSKTSNQMLELFPLEQAFLKVLQLELFYHSEDWRIGVVAPASFFSNSNGLDKEKPPVKSNQIIEAQGWAIDKQGNVELTASHTVAPGNTASSLHKCQPPTKQPY